MTDEQARTELEGCRDRLSDLHLRLSNEARLGWVPGELTGIVKAAQRMLDEAAQDSAVMPAALRLCEYAVSRYGDLPPPPAEPSRSPS